MPVLQVSGPRTHQKLCSFYILYSQAVQGSPVMPIYPDVFPPFDRKKVTLQMKQVKGTKVQSSTYIRGFCRLGSFALLYHAELIVHVIYINSIGRREEFNLSKAI